VRLGVKIKGIFAGRKETGFSKLEQMKENILMTEEARNRLNESSLSHIQTTARVVDQIRSWIKAIDISVEIAISKGLLVDENQNSDIYNSKRLCEYSLLVGLISLDITTEFRIYLNAKEKYEVLYSCKQLIVTINEGYKKIFNYVTVDENGNIKTKDRNKSFWIKDIGILVATKMNSLSKEYEEITNELEVYIENNFQNIKNQRDLAVHYDNNPSKVYDMLIVLDIETIARQTLPFMDILRNMIIFNTKLFEEYRVLIAKKKNDLSDSQHQILEDLRITLENNPE
jgi:hypothetical protein